MLSNQNQITHHIPDSGGHNRPPVFSFHIRCFPTQRETSFHFHSHLELYIIDEQPFAIPGMNIFAHLVVIDSVVSHSVAH